MCQLYPYWFNTPRPLEGEFLYGPRVYFISIISDWNSFAGGFGIGPVNSLGQQMKRTCDLILRPWNMIVDVNWMNVFLLDCHRHQKGSNRLQRLGFIWFRVKMFLLQHWGLSLSVTIGSSPHCFQTAAILAQTIYWTSSEPFARAT